MLIMISLFFGAPIEQPKIQSKESYLDQKYIAYHFDTSFPLHGAPGPLERKKRIFYAYFQIQQAKYSESYYDLVEKIEEIAHHLELDNHKPMSWSEFKQEFQKQGVKSLPVVASHLLGKEKKVEAVIGFGGQRKFDALEEKEMNLFTGVRFELEAGEIDALQASGKQFQIKKVPIITLQNLHGGKVEYAYTLISSSIEESAVEPHLNYLSLVLNGIEDEDLIRLFAQTTYLADGVTTLEKWLAAEVKHYYEVSQIVGPIIDKHKLYYYA